MSHLFLIDSESREGLTLKKGRFESPREGDGASAGEKNGSAAGDRKFFYTRAKNDPEWFSFN